MKDNEKHEICCTCGHSLDAHVEETRDVWFGPAISAWWRCHCLAADGYQCECRLIKWNQEVTHEESKLSDYDVDMRSKELFEQEGLY